MLVDWAGDTIEVLDEGSGAVTRAVVFVAVLPYSGWCSPGRMRI